MPQLIPHYLNNALWDNKSHMVFSAPVPKHLAVSKPLITVTTTVTVRWLILDRLQYG